MATQIISSGVHSSGLTAGAGSALRVLGGGEVSLTDVVSGGVAYISSGGVSVGIAIRAGGLEEVWGIDSGANPTGDRDIFGQQVIEAGGSAFHELLSQSVISSAAGLVAEFDANQDIYGFASGTVLRGGTADVEARGAVQGGRILGSGYAVVSSGGSAIGMQVSSGGVLEVSAGAVIDHIAVASGGVLLNDTGFALNGVTIESGGVIENSSEVSSGQLVSGFIAYAHTSQIIDGGGSAVRSFISGGGEYVEAGGVSISAVVTERLITLDHALMEVDQKVEGSAYHTLVSGAVQMITALGYANGVMLKSRDGTVGDELDYGQTFNVKVYGGAEQDVYGGQATNVKVFSGGLGEVVSMAAAEGTVHHLDVFSGGKEDVYQHAEIHRLTIYDGGFVDNDGVLAGVTISSGGDLFLDSSGHANAVVLTAGAIIDEADRRITSAYVNADDQLVTLDGSKTEKVLNLANDAAGLGFSLKSDGNGGTDIVVTSGGSNRAVSPAASTLLVHAAAGFTRGGGAGDMQRIPHRFAVDLPLGASGALHSGLSRA